MNEHSDYAMIEAKLREGMYPGNRHRCRRDVGRIAGGCLAAGRITPAECDSLGEIAVSLSSDSKTLGEREWNEGVSFGRRQPLESDRPILPTRGASRPLSWDSEIGEDDLRVVREEWLEANPLSEPSDKEWNPCAELTTYLNLLFEPDDIIGYCTHPFEKEGRFIPSNGVYDRTVKQILAKLKKGKFDEAVGTPNEQVGGWIRINPLDGKGTKDVNVADFRYALVESDGMEVEKQVAIYKQLELPCKCIVHSGGKSAHAIVKVYADSLDQYHKRVDFLFEVLSRNNLPVDRQNRNPSRYTRMPGLVRNGKKQYIIERECGKPSWEEWEDWIKDLNDDLPDFEVLDDFDNLPPLAPEQIEGILRVGHKMCVVGPSKAGKSFLLIELAIAVAEGGTWLGRKCRQGKVLYVNLEVDGISCKHRIRDVYKSLGYAKKSKGSLVLWNLRGRTMPLDKLVPKTVRRIQKNNTKFDLIIIDPIYKVLTGDENSASEMAAFCGHIDRLARDCKATLVFCHHHSKGAQGDKRSMDRASGSGVFARDPDALIDLLPLESETARKVYSNNVECDAIADKVTELTYDEKWKQDVSEDDQMVAEKFINAVSRFLGDDVDSMNQVRNARAFAKKEMDAVTGWRASFTLREFPAPKPQNLWFRFPRHYMDDENLLMDCSPEGEVVSRGRGGARVRKEKAEAKMTKPDTLKQAVLFDPNVKWTITKAAEFMKVSERNIYRYLKMLRWHAVGGEIVVPENCKPKPKTPEELPDEPPF